MKTPRFWLVLISLAVIPFSYAEDLTKVRENVISRFNNIKPENIQASPIPGLYQVLMPPRVFYVSADAKYVVDGDVIDLDNKTNLTELQRNKSVLTALDEVGEKNMIVFAPDKPKHTVTVFTDIDCGYCVKLHQAIAEYNKLGIKIRYMAFPRAGIGSPSYDKAVAAWCADDRKQALTTLKSGGTVKSKSCENPVAQHYNLAGMIGLSGTPAMIMDSGRIIPGYVPPKQLAAILDGKMPR